jgi:hypothetical protein
MEKLHPLDLIGAVGFLVGVATLVVATDSTSAAPKPMPTPRVQSRQPVQVVRRTCPVSPAPHRPMQEAAVSDCSAPADTRSASASLSCELP